MAETQKTTEETAVSKSKAQIVKEAQRIEEALLYSSKGHFTASHSWSNFHLWIGIPTVILSAIAGASALGQFDIHHIIAGVCSIVVAILTSIMTFLNPNQKVSAHFAAGNNYDSLMSRVRRFWTIECWQENSDLVLTQRLELFCEQRDKLNQHSPQIPRHAYSKARRGIIEGEAQFAIDSESKS